MAGSIILTPELYRQLEVTFNEKDNTEGSGRPTLVLASETKVMALRVHIKSSRGQGSQHLHKIWDVSGGATDAIEAFVHTIFEWSASKFPIWLFGAPRQYQFLSLEWLWDRTIEDWQQQSGVPSLTVKSITGIGKPLPKDWWPEEVGGAGSWPLISF